MDKTTKKILIRIGMFVIYLLIGGAVFQAMEKKNHDQLREEYFHKINEFVEKYNVSEYDMAELEHLIQCNGKHDAYTRWTFGNSVVFSGTIVSTVGYGHMVPRTTAGRAFCIGYALIGIPLMCLMLKSLGEKIMHWLIYLMRICYKIFKQEKQMEMVHSKAAVFNFFLTIIIILLFGGLSLVKHPDWTYFEGVYFTFVTFTTIGFGDYVPTYGPQMTSFDVITLTLSVVLGFSVVSSLLCSVACALEEYGVVKVIGVAKAGIKQRRAKSQTICLSVKKDSNKDLSRSTKDFEIKCLEAIEYGRWKRKVTFDGEENEECSNYEDNGKGESLRKNLNMGAVNNSHINLSFGSIESDLPDLAACTQSSCKKKAAETLSETYSEKGGNDKIT